MEKGGGYSTGPRQGGNRAVFILRGEKGRAEEREGGDRKYLEYRAVREEIVMQK